MTDLLRCAWAVARKDLMIEARSLQRLAAMISFSLLAGILFNYALETATTGARLMSAGLVWVTVLFAGVLGVGRTFQLEEENAALEGLLLTPMPPAALYLGKVISNYLLVLLVAACTLLTLGLFFHVSFLGVPFEVYALLALGTLGFVALGTLFSAVTARSTMGETLLPVLLFPLLVPVVVFGAGSTGRLMAGLPSSEAWGSLKLLLAYTIVGLLAGVLLIDAAVSDG